MTDAATSHRVRGPGPWREATIVGTATLTPRIRSIVIDPGAPLEHRAGQHVDVRLTAPDGYSVQRSYSIASAPGAGPLIEIAVERLEEGEVSPYFHEVASVGDSIELRGPIGGHFVWSPDRGPLLAVGGGSGLVPLVAMLRQRRIEGSQVPAVLVASTRNAAEMPFRDELLAAEREAGGPRVILLTTREAAARPGDYGRRIDAEIVRDAVSSLPAGDFEAFVCGGNAFVEAAAQGLLGAGIDPGAIRTERYGG